MSVFELNKEQKAELKVELYSCKEEENGQGISYWEIANIDSLVSDEELYDEFDIYIFTEDDFMCSRG